MRIGRIEGARHPASDASGQGIRDAQNGVGAAGVGELIVEGRRVVLGQTRQRDGIVNRIGGLIEGIAQVVQSLLASAATKLEMMIDLVDVVIDWGRSHCWASLSKVISAVDSCSQALRWASRCRTPAALSV